MLSYDTGSAKVTHIDACPQAPRERRSWSMYHDPYDPFDDRGLIGGMTECEWKDALNPDEGDKG